MEYFHWKPISERSMIFAHQHLMKYFEKFDGFKILKTHFWEWNFLKKIPIEFHFLWFQNMKTSKRRCFESSARLTMNWFLRFPVEKFKSNTHANSPPDADIFLISKWTMDSNERAFFISKEYLLKSKGLFNTNEQQKLSINMKFSQNFNLEKLFHLNNQQTWNGNKYNPIISSEKKKYNSILIYIYRYREWGIKNHMYCRLSIELYEFKNVICCMNKTQHIPVVQLWLILIHLLWFSSKD